jgi:hypothetical protein
MSINRGYECASYSSIVKTEAKSPTETSVYRVTFRNTAMLRKGNHIAASVYL